MTNSFGCGFLLKQKSKIGFYFHIPFCPHICPYCDFVKTSKFTPQTIQSYFDNLIHYTKLLLEKTDPSHTHCTVYFGGGTPGLFPAKYYAKIIEAIQKKFHIEECSIETNPFTNSRIKFSDYKSVGFERITLGAQALCEQTLKTLGRKHTSLDVIKNIEDARSLGFEQVQVDLIYGLKNGLRTTTLANEISTLAQAGATGISAYALTIEQRTAFAQTDWANEDSAASEYEELYNACHKQGFVQRETSNFSFYEAMHNNLYWYGLPYIGVGTGAHGLLTASSPHSYGMRYKMGVPLKEIAPGDDDIQGTSASDLFLIENDEPRTQQQYVDELIFTMLRTPHGLPLGSLNRGSVENIEKTLKSDAKIKRALEEGKMIFENGFLKLDWKEKIRGDAWALHVSWAVENLLVNPTQ